MYATASVVIEHPVRECAEALTASPARWFPRLVSRIGNGSDKQLAAVGFHIAGMPVRKRVDVAIGDPSVTGDWVTIPIYWKPTFPAGLFPVFDGRLTLVPHAPGHSRLTISGLYEPPFDSLGRTLDEAMMHSAAEATLKELAESIGAGLNGVLAGRTAAQASS
ncbi:MAG: hypothetical protein E6J02_07435 [Chloroflexi bacterium]|nr:MAG: hypothetical protein E6J02_07435 [Chloroflexota bacterium]TME19363.1 MAG: hypothetical protein E6I63_00265 [Chloroflexota bacterium]